ncbi:MAG: hypothetical protein ED859_03460 [Desulfuromonadales bacterium]|nr:MAG: hypothetical protein ED859_03460 [Desulfuromonadales bacterium]
MVRRALRQTFLLLFLVASPAAAYNSSNVAAEAEQGLKEILDLWRAENFEGLYTRLKHPPGKGWPYFAQRIVHASRIPACCWEMLQDVTITVLDADTVVINARVGFEVEGVGTRFVVRDFTLHRSGRVWMLPQEVVLDLADYNFQRLPRKVYERHIE